MNWKHIEPSYSVFPDEVQDASQCKTWNGCVEYSQRVNAAHLCSMLYEFGKSSGMTDGENDIAHNDRVDGQYLYDWACHVAERQKVLWKAIPSNVAYVFIAGFIAGYESVYDNSRHDWRNTQEGS